METSMTMSRKMFSLFWACTLAITLSGAAVEQAAAQSVEACMQIEVWKQELNQSQPDFNNTEDEIAKNCYFTILMSSSPKDASEKVSSCFLGFCVVNANTHGCLSKSVYLEKYVLVERMKDAAGCP